MSYLIVSADNPYVSPDPSGRFDTMAEVGARLRELGIRAEEVLVKEIDDEAD